MPEKTQQFAQNIARSLIGEEAAHPAQPLIQMQGIRKSYYIGQPNELEILHGIDLTVYPGEFVAIVGESGSGKTTIINLLMRLYEKDAGSIRINGQEVSSIPPHELHTKFGVVFQNDVLFACRSSASSRQLFLRRRWSSSTPCRNGLNTWSPQEEPTSAVDKSRGFCFPERWRVILKS